MSAQRSGVDERTWYKDAVIYELRLRSFYDADGDGIGDFQGLISKLGYLQDLGVTAIWLLPFYPSPGRDDGYDIAHYTEVDPPVGTLNQFEQLVTEAHRRGLKVITELVLNHTSDRHPWFQRARRAPAGSTERGYYVWSDSPDRYRSARIIFNDYESSNWSWDPVAKAYYWHRFFSHQPDLNFESPAVREALYQVVDFWLERGVDGLRLDAVPYLYEEEGTDCENLPRTHAYLKALRTHIDGKYPNRMLLAEANQWPEDAVAYFGHGDECHMNFHFPLMPRLFMAIDQEDRFPVVDIFAQTPEIHASCQWALFLRNHDELTLETVSDEEREAMYRAYAQQPAMRINLGIRRRLAPLVGNSRRKIELLSGLLFSLPGTPVLYYGDEIGMGDNVYLGDRNGVRTPMQWSGDRNSGFSRANPQQLVLPVVIDPEYHYQSVNVENQQQNPSSLLWWTKRLIALRRQHLAFGRGSFEVLKPLNPHVIAYLRRFGDEVLLVVANLSRFVQCVELDLARVDGWTPVELFGKVRLPAITEEPYRLTLGPHDFLWLGLEAPRVATEHVPASRLPQLECASLESLLLGDERSLLAGILPSYLAGRPWFASAGHTLRAVQFTAVPLSDPTLAFVRATAEFADGPTEAYALLLRNRALDGPPPAGAVAVVDQRSAAEPRRGVLVDVLDDPLEAQTLLRQITRQETVEHGGTALSGWTTGEAPAPTATGSVSVSPSNLGSGRDHATLRFGDQFVLKVARRLFPGPVPELEIGRLLAQDGREVLPRLRGGLDLRQDGGPATTLAVLHSYVPNVGTAWELAVQEVSRYLERVLAQGIGELPELPSGSPLTEGAREPSPRMAMALGAFTETTARLGARLAQLHQAFVSSPDPFFQPEAYTRSDLRSRYQSLRGLTGRFWRRLRLRAPTLSGAAHEVAARLLVRETDLLRSFEALLQLPPGGSRIRTHGGLHLGHIFFTGKDFVVSDAIEFGPESPFERRRKHSPLRDLAWVLHSLERAALKAVLEPGRLREMDQAAARPWADAWAWWSAAALLRGYVQEPGSADLLPVAGARAALFESLRTERAVEDALAALEEEEDQALLALVALAGRLSR